MSAEVLQKPELRKSGRFATLLAIGALAFSACGESQGNDTSPQRINNASAVESFPGEEELASSEPTIEEKAQAYCEEQQNTATEGHVIIETTTYYTDPVSGEEIKVSC